MKKLLLFTFISFLSCIPQLHSMSVTEYIQESGMPQIENNSLNISNTNITDLTGLQDIPTIDQIRTLVVSYAQLQTIPKGIFNGFLNNLQNLYLNNNPLQTLPDDIFNNLDALSWLNLNGNQLTSLSTGTFNGLHNLQHLDLNFNPLETLPAGVFNDLNSLEELSLRDNQLTSLPTGIFDNLHNLRRLALTGNPFSASFMPDLIVIIHNIPNDEVRVKLFNWMNYMPKDEAIKRLARTLSPYLLHKLPSDIRKYYNIEPLG